MSHDLESLIRGSTSIEAVITNGALQAALDKRTEDQTEKMTKQLVGVLDHFSREVSGMQREAEDLRIAADKAEQRFNAAREALDYFGKTCNPLPFYRVTGNVEEGTQWLERNGIRVPCVRDKSSAWYVQADDASGDPDVVTVV